MKQNNFDRFYRKNIDRIYRYVFFHAGQNHDLAEDLVSEIFLKVLKNFEDYNEERSKSAWIYTIARNHLANYYRGRKIEVDLEETILFSENNDAHMIELKGIMAKLSKEDRRLVTMKHLEGYKYSEMAEILGRPAGAIKVATHRAIKKIKNNLR